MRPAEKILVADLLITSSLTANGRAYAVRYGRGDYWFADARQLLAWLPWHDWMPNMRRVKAWLHELIAYDADHGN